MTAVHAEFPQWTPANSVNGVMHTPDFQTRILGVYRKPLFARKYTEEGKYLLSKGSEKMNAHKHTDPHSLVCGERGGQANMVRQ
jgi:hypothetical protein